MRISDWSSDVCSSDLLDEADRMLDMGFMPAIKRILQEVPNQRQTLLFSATFDAPIKQLAQQFMRNPVEIQVAARNSVAETVTHRSEEHTSELQSLMRISSAVFCLKKKKKTQ